ncbi:MAG TPA: hypothetical protein VG893_06045 [Terracidiphilus sp.]|nr:hypothetical protein [Terracidiphilus sp.]
MSFPRAAASLALVFAATLLAQSAAPWQMQNSGVTAGLRGIDSVNGRIAWASGTGGIVLRTTDGGAHWQRCATPDAARDGATLDFRGVQGWDANTAVVMSSGPGNMSRLYKTTDGCKSWRLLFANPDAPIGFFDSFWFNGPHGIVVGDPVRGRMTAFLTSNKGKTWKRDGHPGLSVEGKSLAAFAASNSCVPIGNALFARAFATGGTSGAVFFNRPFLEGEGQRGLVDKLVTREPGWKSSPIPLRSGTASAGAFSVAYRYPLTIGACPECGFSDNSLFVAVGGDYTHPDDSTGTAAWSSDGGWTWTAAKTPPHGYRSAVQYSSALALWVAAGTNGSDISRDDGKTWQALDNGDWNALSLPFAVGPKGRIARLNPAALPKP